MLYIYIRYCQSLEPVKPVERRLQVGILSIDGGTNGIGILGTRSGTGQS